MTKKNLFLVALAAVAFAACSDDFADAPPVVTPTPENYEIPIVFSTVSNGGLTRADLTGSAAAEKLGGKFVVSGYKGPNSTYTTTSTTVSGTEVPPSSIVYDNFLVEWHENTANTTESNTANWEYVGVTPIKHAQDKGITRQSVKYWDYTYPQYDFIAWSTGNITPNYTGTPSTDPTVHEVLVSSIDATRATGATGAAYTFAGTAEDLSQCYIADLVTVKKAKYGETVKLTFRSLGTKVRIGIYETIPGYSVKDVKFYTAADVALEDENVADATTAAANKTFNASAKLFTTATVASNKIYTKGTYTVYFPTVNDTDDSDNNQAHIKFEPDGTVAQSNTVDWGTLNYTIAEDAERTEGSVFLGRSSTSASFAGDPSKNYYVYY
ncbi:MAG: hypothetical protein II806_01285, partial [Bacteroidaceae bacterium]|nr:hypothetical protein [Bacteroidaceae bacterium]